VLGGVDMMEHSLLVSILTVPRPNNERYLMQALSTLRREIFASNGMTVAVLVSNMRPESHAVFEEASSEFLFLFSSLEGN